MKTITNQLRHHSVALISLVIALSSLGYNTWRNEQTEANRNVRSAGIELLLKLGELDRVVFFSHFEHDTDRGNPRTGWAYVLTIKDLGALTNEPAVGSSKALVSAWQEHWTGLGKEDAAQKTISASIEQLRAHTHKVLSELD
jgi:hypothetical protein